MRFLSLSIRLSLAVLAFTVSEAVACSCFPPPTVLGAFDRSQHVFVANLGGFEEIDRRVDGTNVYRKYNVHMTVEKVYKGDFRPGQQIKISDGGDGGTCGMSFIRDKIGQRYLFFRATIERKDEDKESAFGISICSRSKKIEDATADLKYLDNRQQFLNKTRLSGKLRAFGEDKPNTAGIKLSITGPRSIEIETDQDGLFEVWNLPPGKYKMMPSLTSGWKIGRYQVLPTTERGYVVDPKGTKTLDFEIAAAKHTELNAFLEIDNQISGRVISPTGNPMKGVCVSAYWLTPSDNGFAIPKDCTNDKGEFRIGELPPGKYALAVNLWGQKSAEHPFEPFYYPNTTKKEEAEVISVGPGVHVNDILIRIGKTVPLVKISGKLTFADGRPFPEEEVRFDPDEEDKFDRVQVETDRDGNFSFTIPKGAAGKLSAITNIYEIRFEKCLKVKELRKNRTGKASDVPSNVVLLNGQDQHESIKLVFPLPYCKPGE